MVSFKIVLPLLFHIIPAQHRGIPSTPAHVHGQSIGPTDGHTCGDADPAPWSDGLNVHPERSFDSEDFHGIGHRNADGWSKWTAPCYTNSNTCQ
jgi:hypothetical protein